MLFLFFGNLRMKLYDFFENSMGTIAEKAGIKKWKLHTIFHHLIRMESGGFSLFSEYFMYCSSLCQMAPFARNRHKKRHRHQKTNRRGVIPARSSDIEEPDRSTEPIQGLLLSRRSLSVYLLLWTGQPVSSEVRPTS